MAAAKAMEIDTLHQIDTGLDPVTAEREQWDDGNNTLAIAPRVAVAYERNVETNARLEEAGIEVVPIAGSELGSGRGGPRCMTCPVSGTAPRSTERPYAARDEMPSFKEPISGGRAQRFPKGGEGLRQSSRCCAGAPGRRRNEGPGRCRRGRRQRPGAATSTSPGRADTNSRTAVAT